MRRDGPGYRRSVGLWAALLWTGCRAPQTSAPEPAVTVARPSPPRARSEVAAAVAVASSPVQLLPDSTLAVGSIAGVEALLAVLDVAALTARHREQYDQLAALLVSSAGVNLLDPTQWRELGLEPDGPIGGAVLDVRSGTYVGFMTLADPDKFRAFLDKVGGSRRLQPVLEDRGVVLKYALEDSRALVLRDGFVLYVTTDRPQEAPYDFARLLATIDPARGLTATPRYQRATARPGPPGSWTGYVDVWAIVQAQARAREGREAPGWAAQALEQAVRTDAPAQEQAQLRQQLAEEQLWQGRQAARQEREMAALRRWLGPVEPVVFDFTASRTGVVGEIRAKMPESAPLREVLQNAATPSPVLAALGERPVLELGGSVAVAALVASFEELVVAAGEAPEEAYAALRDATKVDLKKDLAPLLTGTGGLAVTASEKLLRGETSGGASELGFAAALAVRDVPAAQALLARAVGGLGFKVGKDARTGAHMLAVPGYRAVYVTVTGGQLVATTDVGVIRRLAGGGAPSLGLAAAAVPVMTAREVAFQGLVDMALPMFLLRPHNWTMEDRRSLEPYAAFPGLTPAQVDRVPRSRAYKAKLRAWEAMGTKIHQEELAQERGQRQQLMAWAQGLGVLAGNLREAPDGVVLTGGQLFGAGGLTRAVDLAFQRLTARPEERSWELYDERAALEGELRRLRVGEVAAALHVPSPLE